MAFAQKTFSWRFTIHRVLFAFFYFRHFLKRFISVPFAIVWDFSPVLPNIGFFSPVLPYIGFFSPFRDSDLLRRVSSDGILFTAMRQIKPVWSDAIMLCDLSISSMSRNPGRMPSWRISYVNTSMPCFLTEFLRYSLPLPLRCLFILVLQHRALIYRYIPYHSQCW